MPVHPLPASCLPLLTLPSVPLSVSPCSRCSPFVVSFIFISSFPDTCLILSMHTCHLYPCQPLCLPLLPVCNPCQPQCLPLFPFLTPANTPLSTSAPCHLYPACCPCLPLLPFFFSNPCMSPCLPQFHFSNPCLPPLPLPPVSIPCIPLFHFSNPCKSPSVLLPRPLQLLCHVCVYLSYTPI